MATTRNSRQSYIDNDEMYRNYPHMHEVACASFPEVTEESYPAVEGWYITFGTDGEPDGGIVEPVFADWYGATNERN